MKPDDRFGTGLWRHNRDRFIRAVDRYYTTAVAIHKAHETSTKAAVAGTTAGTDTTVGTDDSATTSAGDVNTIVDGTHRLNDLVPVVDEITGWLHEHHPVTGQVVPSNTRERVGDTPELLTRASSKVAEAVLAASMARAEITSGRPIALSAQAAERFITDAAELLERAQANLDRLGGS